ncbi:hypothetical protein CONPUDRAFT_110521 [Coniophora puteana RWD-64-598 SS2]|uniref:ubiquitinyl hydrolase 1 n=1 Tax=Coniophora puteana (strain RWD-64-598) TaxID=741705 RepID=A0A5M3MDB4_CONPW|nr:uncharacterized protein CONPUDRAFT_110521 [Coniophora puteana RWD-64-598 SS2]EIW76860.1 hypothetical protein CONPUDRAFT_110521 [Coniophora puteana RWD-64-598 SS2]
MDSQGESLADLHYIINHVCMPLKLPQSSDDNASKDAALASLTYRYAKSFRSYVLPEHLQAWDAVTVMLWHLHDSASKTYLSAKSIHSQLQSMQDGEFRVLFIRRQNAGLIVRKERDCTIFESFEASPSPDAVMQATGKLQCSYPGPAVSVPHPVGSGPEFLGQLSRFLEGLDEEEFLDAIPHTKKAGTLVPETRDTINPRYITELLTGILLGVGTPAEIPRVSKRIGDDVLWLDAELPWRRSPLWLVIRVSIQTTLSRMPGGRLVYKSFILFLICHISQHVLNNHLAHFPDDILFQMSAKMSRRLYKLGSSAPPRLAKLMCEVAEAMRSALEKRSKTLIPSPLPILQLDVSNFERDVNLSLKNSRLYIERALSFRASSNSSSLFTRNEVLRQRNLTVFLKILEAQLSGLRDDEKYLTLIDFEAAVHDSLHNTKFWCSTIADIATTSISIMKAMSTYYDSAVILYTHNPENLSIMYLTLLLLWVALDHLTLTKIPLLWNYHPEFDHTVFQPLLLRTQRFRTLLQGALAHLSSRHAKAVHKPILEGDMDGQSFPVKYFRRSSQLQSLKERIEDDAEAGKSKKLEELRQKTRDYEDKLQQTHDLPHEQCRRGQVKKGKKGKGKKGKGKKGHVQPCLRCRLENEAKTMKIDIHEWPLPSDHLQAMCAIFELECPVPFAAWRDATYHFVANVLSPTSSASAGEKQEWYGVLNPDASGSSIYMPLVKYARGSGFRRRITMGSSTKSFLQSHYRSILLSTRPGDGSVAVNNALRFSLFDTARDQRSGKGLTPQDIVKSCTFPIPQGLYSNLAYTLQTTTHSTNEVLARQSECHPQLSLREYWAYGSLRSGARLQWMNILRVLRDRSLNFREVEVYLLCVQASLQVGPFNVDSFESWHSLLHDREFCLSLIQELKKLLAAIQQNWLEFFAMLFIIDVLLRVLSSSTNDTVLKEAYRTLRECRSVSTAWLEELCKHPDRSRDDQIQLRIHNIATTCLATFDTEAPHIDFLLSRNDSNDVTQLVKASIILDEYTPALAEALSDSSRRLSERARRSAVLLEPHVFDRIVLDRTGLDRAIHFVWAGYRPDVNKQWTRVKAPNSCWISCRTLQTTYQSSQTVHYDLLRGALLVDGKPLARLPSSVTRHHTYAQLFAEQILEIVPSDLPGMQYATRDLIENHQVFFGLVGDIPVIRAKQNESDVLLELIPSERLRGDIPLPFVNGHTHWLNLSSRVIEVRPAHRRWEPLHESDWRIHYSTHRSRMICRSGQGAVSHIVDPSSSTCSMLSRYLTPIELPIFQVVTWTPGTVSGKLLIELPRLGLSFLLNSRGRLQSRELTKFVVDKNQSTGTMVGLQNQLVLAPNPSDDCSGEEMRRVIIPRGSISYTTLSRHPQISIHNPDSLGRVSYDVYKVDTILGRLELDGLASITSRLYKAYLHAISTQCLPDPLTQRTGTEEALRELRSAACLSFSSLQDEDVILLQCISKLTPRRHYYPPHKRERMQSVFWGSLSSVAQHEAFFEAVTDIVAHAKRMNIIDFTLCQAISDFTEPTEGSGGDYSKLLRRAKLRRRVIQRDGFASFVCDGQDLDVVYHSQRDASREALVQQISSTSAMVFRWSRGLSALPPSDLFGAMKSISSGSTLEGPKHRHSSLQYNRVWLSEPRTIWLTALELCRKVPNKFQLLFTLPSMSYCTHYRESQELIVALFCIAYEASAGPAPSAFLHSSYTLNDGIDLNASVLNRVISTRCRPLRDCPEGSWTRASAESHAAFQSRQIKAHSSALSKLKSTLLDVLLSQWKMGEMPLQPPGEFVLYFDLDRLLSEVSDLFSSRRNNKELQVYTIRLLRQLSQSTWTTIRTQRYSFSPASKRTKPFPSGLSSLDLLSRAACRGFSFPTSLLAQYFRVNTYSNPARLDDRLRSLITRIRGLSQEPPYDIYSKNLDRSRSALASGRLSDPGRVDRATIRSLAEEDLRRCRDRMILSCDVIIRALAPQADHEMALVHTGLWPSLSTLCLLRHLDLHHFSSLIPVWKNTFTEFARIIIALQTSQRRAVMAKRGDYQDLIHDLEQTKDQCYTTTACPDWLLLQIDGDFTLRDVQHQIAGEMISQGSHQSITLQLNMGEGKSSVIAPLAASVIADKSKLVRLIVLKSLAAQMAHTMENRLTGLANRRVYYLPFTRSTQLDSETLKAVRSVLEECRESGGILIVQPEHILSMKLRAVECQLSKDLNSAAALAHLQRFIFNYGRDILDESDEILHVRYQLVYTCGTHQHVQGHPNRWTTTQEILRLARGHLHQLFLKDPSMFSTQGTSRFEDAHPSAFPPVRLVQSSPAANQLLRLLVSDILEGRLSNCNLHHFDESERNAFEMFISVPSLTIQAQDCLSNLRVRGALDENVWSLALLLRGLIAHEVLLFCLRDKRYRVDYGLDLRRSMLAVPYRAKDVPSTTAEFGHPDVVILLTCLSYYLSGLSETQLETCIRFLLISDNPTSVYEDWLALIANSDLPESLKSFNGLNYDSVEQRRLLSELFGNNQATIDFYLRTVVFPQQAKEFESKLVTSGWDIAEPKSHITTGFSGTNDFQHLLPTYILQRDPQHQLSTNARVLNYMLRDENDHYETFNFPDGLHFVEVLSRKQPKIRMLLDVGAQMLDVQNKELVDHWLRHESPEESIAAIYVNDHDELTVLHRNGYEEPLSTSHVNQHLGQCIVYLDDAHTRGMDVKLPSGFRAAVTLGPRVTKDRLAQGCMRMRRLGSGHTIAFFAPPEVDTRIRRVASKKSLNRISVEDVLLWTISETCTELKARALQWAYQGTDHSIRYNAWSDFINAESSDGSELKDLRRAWMQQEAHTLEELYGIHSRGLMDPLRDIMKFPRILQGCLKFGLSPTSAEQEVTLDEEQEREVSHEIEREEEVQRLSSKSPWQHYLSADLKNFVQTGFFPERSLDFTQAISLLADTPAELPSGWKKQLWATRDFAKTIFSRSPELDFFRPVQWVLSTAAFGPTGKGAVFVLISSYEANELLPDIRRYMKVQLHVFTPRLTWEMSPCDDLQFFTIRPLEHPTLVPARIRTELILFSGQLYLSSNDDYVELCKFLGVFGNDLKGLPKPRVSHDGFIQPWDRQLGIRAESPFLTSPIPALAALTKTRLKGMSFSHTHIGKILNGRSLLPKDFGLDGKQISKCLRPSSLQPADEVSSSWFTRAISAATRFIFASTSK